MVDVNRAVIVIDGNASGWQKAYNSTVRDLRDLGGSALRLGAVMTGLSAPIYGVGLSAIQMSAQMEQASIAFTTLLKDGTKAQKFLEDLRDFAAKTPFTFVGLQNSARMLMAYGFTAEQVLPTMQAVGDAAAALGGGEDKINRIILAIGQMRSKGTVQAQEMLQLTEAGIGAWKMLADALNTDVAGAMKLVERRAVDSEKGVKALLDGMEAVSGGMMQGQMQTISGLWSNLQDAMDKALTEVGKEITESLRLKDAIRDLTDDVADAVKWFQGLSPETKKLAIELAAVAAAAGPVLLGIGGISLGISAAAPAIAGLLGFIAGPGGLVIALGGLAASLITAADGWDDIFKAMQKAAAFAKENKDYLTLGLSAIARKEQGLAGTHERLRNDENAMARSQADLAGKLRAERDRQRGVMTGPENPFPNGRLSPTLRPYPAMVGNAMQQGMAGAAGFFEKAPAGLQAWANSINNYLHTPAAKGVKIAGDLMNALDHVDHQAQVLGPSFDSAGEKLRQAEQAMIDLKDAGVDPTDAAFQRVNNTLKECRQNVEGIGGAWEAFKSTLISTKPLAVEIGEAFGGFVKEGIQGVGDALAQVIVYGKDAGEMFLELGKRILASIISTLVAIGIQRMLSAVLGAGAATIEASSNIGAQAGIVAAKAYATVGWIPIVGAALGTAAAATAAMGLIGAATAASIAGKTAGVAAAAPIGAAEGAIITKPTLAVVGEGGEPEGVFPLSRAGDFGFGGSGRQTIQVLLDGEVIISKVVRGMPKYLRMHGVAR